MSARTDAPRSVVDEATDPSAVHVAVIAVGSAVGLLLLWPTDPLVIGRDEALLAAFGRYRLLAIACCVTLAWSVLRVPVVRRHPSTALLVGILVASGLTLHSLGSDAALQHRWMDLRYLLPLATCGLLVPLGRRIAVNGLLAAGWVGLHAWVVPQELGREFAWVRALVQLLAVGLSIYVGHVMTRLFSRAWAAARLLGRSNERLTQRVAARQRELRARYAQLVHAREEERVRLGRELHDATGQILTGLRLGLGPLQRAAPQAAVQHAARIDATIDELFAALQRIQLELHPRVLDDLGLRAALHWLAEITTERHGVQARLRVDGRTWNPALVPGEPQAEPQPDAYDEAYVDDESEDAELPGPARLGLYRVAQLGLELFARIDGAAVLTLGLSTEAWSVVLRVEGDVALPDEGDPRQPGAGAAIDPAWVEVTERARMLGADLSIRRARPAAITVRLPREDP